MRFLPQFSVENPVLVGVLMMAILVGGAVASLSLVREMFPESRPDQIMIVTPYPGATPAEVEKGITLRIEEAIKDVEYIEKIEAQVNEGLSTIIVTMTNESKDLNQAVNDFKAAVDAIPRDELPEEAEETRVSKFDPILPVISISLYGAVDEAALKKAGRRVRDDLLRLPDITDVELDGIRKAELTVEMEPEKLLAYGLTLAQVSDAIHQSNLDLPGGQVKTSDQNVAVRTLGETGESEMIAETILRTTPTGEVVRVRDVGRVIEGFEDTDVSGHFNGERAVTVTVFKTGSQDAVDIAAKVKAYVAGKQGEPLTQTRMDRLKTTLGLATTVDDVWRRSSNDPLQAGIHIETHSNLARFIEDRLDLLKRNGLFGLVLVFISLLVFLNWRVALWVMMGLLVAIAGSIMLMTLAGATLNLISMFGLIVVLGLLVDDAIVVGENVYSWVERGEDVRVAAVKGTQEVTWPVIIACTTTIGAFLPLMFIEGQMGDFMGVLPVVVTCALTISLIEALMILPCHLADWLKPVRKDLVQHAPRHWLARRIAPWRQHQRAAMQHYFGGPYRWLLRTAVEYRYVTVAATIAVLIASVGMIAGGKVPFVFIQKMDSETVVADLEMPVGTPMPRTAQALALIEQAILDLPKGELANMWSAAGTRLSIGQSGAFATEKSHTAQCIIELSSVEHRSRTSEEIIAELREKTAGIPGAESIRFEPMLGGPGGKEIEIEVTGDRMDDLLASAGEIKERLGKFQGVFDIDDDFETGRREVQIELLDSARPLNLTTRYLATEVRGAFYGLEARTLQLDREDVDIRVRFPEDRRRHIHELESMWIATPAGENVPLSEVALVREDRGFASIRRVDQRRAVVVSADVDQARGNATEITAVLDATLRDLEGRYPGLRIQYAGTKLETTKSLHSLKRDFFIAVAVIFVMLAGLFKSYVQGLIVLAAIPFGLNGAVFGHWVMGYPLTILSLIGLVALTGIVVNDSLVLVDFINKRIAQGQPVMQAVIDGGTSRLRAIFLTSLTTILGLAPLMLETSFQARFLIPMAISISYGLLFSTVLTLIVVPAIYMIVYDLQRFACRLWYGRAEMPAETA